MAQMYFSDYELAQKGIRLPSSLHEGRNGFRPPVTNFGQVSVPLPDTDAEPSYAALDAHRTAQYILTQKDRPIPTLEQMRKELEQEVTKESLMSRIEALRAQHLSDMQRMYTWHAEEYLQDAHDMYLSLDDSLYPPKGDDDANLLESQKDIQKFYAESRRYIPEQMRWEDELEHLRHSHLELLLPLYKELNDLERRQEEERKRREADFPMTIADFDSKSPEVQMRVATFLLTNDEMRREKMLTEFGWASRQVKPLLEIFKKDDSFKTRLILKKMVYKP